MSGDAHEEDKRLGHAGIRIVGAFVASAGAVIVGMMVPCRIKNVVAKVVKRYGVRVNALVAVIVQEQPVRKRHPNKQRNNQRRYHSSLVS